MQKITKREKVVKVLANYSLDYILEVSFIVCQVSALVESDIQVEPLVLKKMWEALRFNDLDESDKAILLVKKALNLFLTEDSPVTETIKNAYIKYKNILSNYEYDEDDFENLSEVLEIVYKCF